MLPRFFVTLTRELVHHHRSLSFAAHCLNPGHVRVVESHVHFFGIYGGSVDRGMFTAEARRKPKKNLPRMSRDERTL